LKALSKAPDRRYGSAHELAVDLERHLEGRPVTARADARGYILRHHARRHRVALLVVPVVAAAILAFVVSPGDGSRATPVVPGTVAVVPFRVSGADASLGYLREGMVDLLSSKLNGEGGPQAIAPATVLAAWQEEGGSPVRDLPERRALAAASRVGAERLVAGEVVGTPTAMILGATLMTVADGKVEARVTVEGPADSLLPLTDELTSRLLILGSGVDVRPLGAAASTSLPAIRAYLEGRVHFRGGRYDEAYDRFGDAFELDSTLALAAVDMYRSAWFSQRNAGDQLLQVAWRGRERLDEDALRLVEATLGPDYPQPFAQVDRLAARRRLVERNPGQVDHVYMYADRMHHWHAQIEIPDGRRRAAAQFRRALELDSTFAPTYQHLIPLLYSLGMNEEATRAAQAYLRREPTGSIRSFLSWRMAAAHADSAGLANIRAAMHSLSDGELLQIYRTAVQDAVEVGDAENAMAVLRARGLAPSKQRYVLREDFAFQLLRGRPAAAVEVAARLREAQADEEDFPRLEARNALVLTALYGDGDSTAARHALDALVADFEQGVSASGNAGIPDLCTIAQWRAWHADGRGIRRAVARLRAADNTGVLKDTGPLCAVLVEAIEAVLRNRSDAGVWVARLDSIVATGPSALYAESVVPATLAAALLHEALGNPAGALAAVRRRVYDLDTTNLLLATSLRLEGRFAALAGDTASAARAYRHYLVLRDDPEAALRAQADSVRAALASLESG
jgi:tetratricopeptide (TPR) repeat protein